MDQMFGSRNEVIEDVLFELQHATTVPGPAELEPSANDCDGINTALFDPKSAILLHPERILGHERGQPYCSEAAIPHEQGGIVAIHAHIFAVHDVHGTASSVGGFVPLLLHHDVAGVE